MQTRLTCEQCGKMDSTLRVIQFFDDTTGVWCETHARAQRRAAQFYQPEGPPQTPDLRGPPSFELSHESSELLKAVAWELRLRGENAEADRAEEAAARYASQAARGL